jgi:peptidyl-prolyl cis-trans isomerase SurA
MNGKEGDGGRSRPPSHIPVITGPVVPSRTQELMRKSFIVLGLLLAAAPAAAQITAPTANGEEVVDRVIAVVGDTVLLYSEVRAELMDMMAAGQIPRDPATLDQYFPQLVETKVQNLILVTAAREAGFDAPAEQVNEQVEAQIREVQRQFGSELAFTAALAERGYTRDQYRQQVASSIRDQYLVEQYLSLRMRNRARPVIDERDIRTFFEENRQNLGQRPATVTFRQVVVAPRPTPEARRAAIERAEEVLVELNQGGDFAVLARRFSDDPGSRDHGGDVGWFRQGMGFAPEFERVAFMLRPGQTSGIVETEFGFHIIQVERIRGTERQARHILIRPEVTEADFQTARERADSVATAIRGGESIATLAGRYNRGDDLVTVRETVDRLPLDYSEALADARVGDLVGPFVVENPRGNRWAVVRLTERTEAGDPTLDDYREQIRQRLQQEAMIEQFLGELRDQGYVSILLD